MVCLAVFVIAWRRQIALAAAKPLLAFLRVCCLVVFGIAWRSQLALTAVKPALTRLWVVCLVARGTSVQMHTPLWRGWGVVCGIDWKTWIAPAVWVPTYTHP